MIRNCVTDRDSIGLAIADDTRVSRDCGMQRTSGLFLIDDRGDGENKPCGAIP